MGQPRKRNARRVAAAAVAADSTVEVRQRSLIARLSRVEGQLRGIQGMIADGADCESVAQQVAAARRALDRAFYELVACSMEHELDGAADIATARAAGEQLARILAKYG